MDFRDLLYEIGQALKANKGRSALTILGIVIGIAAVVALTSLVAGMKQDLLSQVGADQARLIQYYATDGVSKADLDYVKKTVPGYEKLAFFDSMGSGEVSTKSKSIQSTLYTVEAGLMERMGKSYPLNKGRYFSESDDKGARMVCILDAETTKQLFGSDDADAVGKVVKLGSDNYSVIGTLKRQSGSNFGMGSTFFVPRGTAEARLGARSDNGHLFIGIADEKADPDVLKTKTIEKLKQRQPQKNKSNGKNEMDSIAGYTQKDMADMVNQITGVFSAILSSVASISLLVGGIGIMNMMLTNVTERIREIGLRKSIGAKSRDIINQFLGESIFLCLVGGLVGLIVGYLGALGVAGLIGIFMPDMAVKPIVTPGIALTAFGVSAFIGILFGWGPARRAAKLDPVESLRHQ